MDKEHFFTWMFPHIDTVKVKSNCTEGREKTQRSASANVRILYFTSFRNISIGPFTGKKFHSSVFKLSKKMENDRYGNVRFCSNI